MFMAEILETLMVVCFSTGWYGSIRRVWQAQDSRGHSWTMPVLVAVGCAFGLGSKLALFASTGYGGFLILVYAWNIVLSLAHLYLLRQFSDQLDSRRFAGVDPSDAESAPAAG
ncbi:MAG TPA: hypothetical protein VMM55_00180 [Thermohalobaculum sp.]|nr:hypothetical protein [Thermohalobaculum sp.]